MIQPADLKVKIVDASDLIPSSPGVIPYGVKATTDSKYGPIEVMAIINSRYNEGCAEWDDLLNTLKTDLAAMANDKLDRMRRYQESQSATQNSLFQ